MPHIDPCNLRQLIVPLFMTGDAAQVQAILRVTHFNTMTQPASSFAAYFVGYPVSPYGMQGLRQDRSTSSAGDAVACPWVYFRACTLCMRSGLSHKAHRHPNYS